MIEAIQKKKIKEDIQIIINEKKDSKMINLIGKVDLLERDNMSEMKALREKNKKRKNQSHRRDRIIRN